MCGLSVIRQRPLETKRKVIESPKQGEKSGEAKAKGKMLPEEVVLRV